MIEASLACRSSRTAALASPNLSHAAMAVLYDTWGAEAHENNAMGREAARVCRGGKVQYRHVCIPSCSTGYHRFAPYCSTSNMKDNVFMGLHEPSRKLSMLIFVTTTDPS